MAISHLTRMKTLVAADLLEELRTEDLARYGMTPDKFSKTPWEAGFVHGKAYAIPLDTHPFVMFYNTDVCKKAGLLDADGKLKPLDGPDAFTEALAKGKQATGKYGGVVAITNETSTPWRMFWSLYSQLGGQWLADQGSFRIFRTVILPLTRPAVAAVAIFTFVFTWNNLLWPLLVLTNPDLMTIPVGLATVQGSFGIRYADTMASAILGALPLIAVFLLFQRHIVEGIAGTGLKG